NEDGIISKNVLAECAMLGMPGNTLWLVDDNHANFPSGFEFMDISIFLQWLRKRSYILMTQSAFMLASKNHDSLNRLLHKGKTTYLFTIVIQQAITAGILPLSPLAQQLQQLFNNKILMCFYNEDGIISKNMYFVRWDPIALHNFMGLDHLNYMWLRKRVT
ncbi:hypothetical protein ACJX0J_019191, partial [Zea mays]